MMDTAFNAMVLKGAACALPYLAVAALFVGLYYAAKRAGRRR